MIDITPADQEIVTTILKKHVPHAEVRVFGSRHKWTAKPYSDLDLAIVADAKLDKQIIYDLEEAFEESELSFRVDVIDWYAISDEFRAIIEQGYTVIQERQLTKLKEYELQELIDKFIDYRGKTPRKTTHGIPLITAKIIKNGRIQEPTEFIAVNDYSKWMTRGFPELNDVVLTTEAPLGEVALIKDTKVALAQRIITLQTNKDLCNSVYLKYLLQSSHGQSILQSRISGSTVQGIKSSELKKLKVKMPPLDEQKEIAAILSSLDDKIELNQQINKKLEEIAQSIFKEWFIDFNFPDENGNPYRDSGGAMIDSELGQIPASWSVGKLGEEFNITMGQSPAGASYNENQEGMIFFQGRTDFGIRFPSIRLFTTQPKRVAKQFDILLSVRAPVGDINIALQDCCIGRGLAAINAKNKSYCYYKLQFLQQQFNIYNGTGTVFGAINKDQLHGLSILIPTQNVIKDFEDIVSTVDEKIYHNHLEILNLYNTRDTLLPKLLSGGLLT